jgi:hypothetical protein
MDADGTNQRNLTNDPATDNEPAWSPDGNSIDCSAVTQLRHQEVEYILQKTEAVAGKVRIDGDSNLA